MILFIGDKPSPKMKPGALPFQGAACEPRLKEWIKQITFLPIIVNSSEPELLDMVFMFKALNYPIVALGNNASKALKDIPHFKLPHPSGLNRQINDKEFVALKLAECKSYIETFQNSTFK